MKIGGNFQDAYTNSLRNRARSGFTESGYVPSADCAAYGGGRFEPNCAVLEEALARAEPILLPATSVTHTVIFIASPLASTLSDDWKVTNRLTLTLGMRYDLAGALEEDHNLGVQFLSRYRPR